MLYSLYYNMRSSLVQVILLVLVSIKEDPPFYIVLPQNPAPFLFYLEGAFSRATRGDLRACLHRLAQSRTRHSSSALSSGEYAVEAHAPPRSPTHSMKRSKRRWARCRIFHATARRAGFHLLRMTLSTRISQRPLQHLSPVTAGQQAGVRTGQHRFLR